MAVLGRYDNRDLSKKVVEVILTVDAAVAGAIGSTADGRFVVTTKGLVPAIDHITGASFDECWSKIVDRVGEGGVCLTRMITGTRYDGEPTYSRPSIAP